MNAVRQGLRAETLVLAWEDENEFEDIQIQLIAEYGPIGMVENMLVERICLAFWRLRRASKFETSIFAIADIEANGQFLKELRSLNYTLEVITNCIDARNRARSENSAEDNVTYIESLFPKVSDEQVDRESEKYLTVPVQVYKLATASDDVICKLHRYETSILRELYRAISELERIQDRRERDATKGNPKVELDGEVNALRKSGSNVQRLPVKGTD